MPKSLQTQKSKYTVPLPVCQWKKASDSNPETDAQIPSSGVRSGRRCRLLNGDGEARVSDSL